MGQTRFDDIRVGAVSISMQRAQEWVARYTAAENESVRKPYAYPAYDHFECETNDPRKITDADLMAPGLLNVPIKIRSYYGLRSIRADLEAGLENEDLALPLADIDNPMRVAAMVKPLYSVLDDPRRRPWNVKATTLSKVLHRKRPNSLVLHDVWVQACYAGSAGPVEWDENRSWSDYMVAITLAIGHDLRTQREAFDLIDQATSSPGDLTHVRLLDILAWTSKGAGHSEGTDSRP